MVLASMAVFRELLGSGTLLGYRIIPEGYQIGVMTQTPGGFFTFGLWMAMLTAALAASGKKFKPEIKCCGACTGCAMAGSCENKEEETK